MNTPKSRAAQAQSGDIKMRTSTAAVGSAVFFILAPGTVAGLIPWLITHWEF
jgi:hypothetical protein